jgi:hypothetical protein
MTIVSSALQERRRCTRHFLKADALPLKADALPLKADALPLSENEMRKTSQLRFEVTWGASALLHHLQGEGGQISLLSGLFDRQ